MLATSALFHPHAVAAVADKDADDLRRRAARTLIAAIGSLLAGYLFALLAIHGLWTHGDEPTVTAGFNAFALLFVMSLAIERLIAPIAPILGPDTTVAKAKLLSAKAAAPAPVPGQSGPMAHAAGLAGVASPVAVVHAEGEVADSRSKTALVTWGVATGLACILSASLNVTLLHAMTTTTGTHSPFWVDLLVTGLVVGAGTKPLNDLWSRLQNKP